MFEDFIICESPFCHSRLCNYGSEIAMYVAIAATVASAAISTYAAVSSAQQQAEEADAIRKQRANEAQTARESAAFEEHQSRRKTALLLGQQRAVMAAAGVETTSGSPLIQDIDLTKQAELEALNIRRAGRIAGGGYDFESRLARYRRDVALGGIPLTILGGVFDAASSSYGAYTKATTRKSMLKDWGYM